ncbi:MAG: hypothetical protein V7785_18080 [Bermanella sp.]
MYKHFKAPLFRGFFLSLLLPTFTSVHGGELHSHSPRTVWFGISSDNYSEAITLQDLYEDEPESVKKGDLIYSFSQWQFGYQLNNSFGFGFIRGLDIYAQHSPDAASIYYSSNASGQDFEERDYKYQLDGNVQRTQGIFLTYDTLVGDLAIQSMFEAGQAFGLTSVDINGDLSYQDDQLIGTADIDYFYEKDALYKREVDKPEGNYWSVSINLIYPSPLGKHMLSIQDLFNQTHWHAAPFTQVQINTDRVATTNENGNTVFRPLGSGLETYKSKTQVFPRQIDFKNNLDFNEHLEFIIGAKSIDKDVWPYLGSAILAEDIEIAYHIKQESISVSQILGPNFRYRLEADQLFIDKTHRLLFSAEISY